ncbi:MAG: putative PEP-binding protein, partial [Anaerovoracaceae bacterium]|nr:putative PEP-binding protein [Anaerovoracaceae bacterium]
VTTRGCRKFLDNRRTFTDEMKISIREKIREIEEVTGRQFGSEDNPLLVSVRSSSVVSIPTMAHTVLNLGLNEKTVRGLALRFGSMETALDCYTRFLRTYGSVVRGITEGEFLSAYSAIKNKAKALTEEYSEEAVLFDAVEAYKKIIFSKTGRPVPEDPYEQLEEAAGANLSRWESEETQVYRELHEIPEDIYTAAVIQAMVYGNIDENSCTGTVFTRDPSTGERTACGEFLVKAQGGDRTFRDMTAVRIERIKDFFPQLYDRFVMIANLLERYNRDMQEIEFTIQQGRLFMLETKSGRRTPSAAVKIAVEMVKEGMITRETAVANLRPADINDLVIFGIKKNEDIGEETIHNFHTILEWADDMRVMGVRANIDTPEDARIALRLGAEGVGLCRTEHMFFSEDRIYDFIDMIIADNDDERARALSKLKKYQKEDFKKIFTIMEDRPVTIRLLDPSFHNVLPHSEKEIKALAGKLDVTEKKLSAKIIMLKEENPEMGRRGSRLAVAHPEIARMQTEAVIEAAFEVDRENDFVPDISIMVPFVSTAREFYYVKDVVDEAARNTMKRLDADIDYSVGTMIETPRAAILAGSIAEKADFFSFGTNDLTELVYGLSRADSEELIEEYIDKDILDKNPFHSLDKTGVGRIIEMAASAGRKTKPRLRIGLSGDHGGESESIEFCERIGVDYFSCSTLRIPGTRLAAAQAQIRASARER